MKEIKQFAFINGEPKVILSTPKNNSSDRMISCRHGDYFNNVELEKYIEISKILPNFSIGFNYLNPLKDIIKANI